MSNNELAHIGSPVPASWDLVGPTVDDDVRRAIDRYGAEAVKEAVKLQTKRKVGRKPEADWPELHRVLQEDARKWLDGEDPFSERSNYSIAKDYAAQNPGQSCPATHRRILQKLSERRVCLTIIHAWLISETDYPYQTHLRALGELGTFEGWADRAAVMLKEAHANIADYTAKNGRPEDNMTIKEIEKGARMALADIIALERGILSSLAFGLTPKGMFGRGGNLFKP
ncbi:MAG: hypothetical protein E2598_12650 [Sphingobium sp.]|nr:hypothetical protein [Sphingobium sp.]